MLPETDPRGDSVVTDELANAAVRRSGPMAVLPAALPAASAGGGASRLVGAGRSSGVLGSGRGRPLPVIDVLGLPLDAEGNLRAGWTHEMVRELAEGKFALHAMSMFDGIAPSRKEFQLVVPCERVYRRYYGSYTRFVQSSGYKFAVERQTLAAMTRRRAAWDAERRRKAGKLARRGEMRAAAGAVDAVASSVASESVASDCVALDLVAVDSGGAASAPDLLEVKEKRETVYGVRISGCDMVHAPTNEQGVVLLFGMLAGKLGFEVEMVRTGYPDCEAKRKGEDGKLRRVRIEFEFLSSRFDHNPDECDLIVCWEDDRNTSGLEVLELKKHVGIGASG